MHVFWSISTLKKLLLISNAYKNSSPTSEWFWPHWAIFVPCHLPTIVLLSLLIFWNLQSKRNLGQVLFLCIRVDNSESADFASKCSLSCLTTDPTASSLGGQNISNSLVWTHCLVWTRTKLLADLTSSRLEYEDFKIVWYFPNSKEAKTYYENRRSFQAIPSDRWVG